MTTHHTQTTDNILADIKAGVERLDALQARIEELRGELNRDFAAADRELNGFVEALEKLAQED